MEKNRQKHKITKEKKRDTKDKKDEKMKY